MTRRRTGGTLSRSAALGATAALALAIPAPALAAERGIELISPLETNGQSLNEGWGSPDADRAFFATEATSNGLRTAHRTDTGWAWSSPLAQEVGVGVSVVALSTDGTRMVTKDETPSGPEIGSRTDGLYLHAPGQPVRPLVTVPNPPPFMPRYEFYAADEDVRLLYLRAEPNTLPGPTSASGLYRWNDGIGRFETVEIDDPRVQECGSYSATFGGKTTVLQNGISADGRRVILRNNQCTVPGSSPTRTVPPHLYVWEDGVATDITRPLPGEADGAATLLGMSRDASRVFFTSTGKLTTDSTAGRAELYVHEGGQTTRITGPDGMTFATGFSPRVSGDGSTVWFVADTLVNGPDRQRLLRWSDGSQRQIAAAPLNGFNPTSANYEVSRDGSALLLGNATDFTGRGITGAQLHRFDADGTVECVSCPPPGQPMVAVAGQKTGWTTWYPHLTADGSRIAFQTSTALVPHDVNGRSDVYLWEDGRTTLISSGTVDGDADLVGMSWDASRVYFLSWGALLPGTVDPYRKLYVSRVGGGFSTGSSGDDACGADCQGEVTPQPILPGPASPSFFGPGNVVPAVADAPQATVAKIRVTRPKAVRGTTSVVRVRVPGKGRIRTSGSGLKRGSRATNRATTYRVNVRLSPRATRTLRRTGTVKTRVTVRFTPARGKAQTVRVPVTFQRPKAGSRTAAGGQR